MEQGAWGMGHRAGNNGIMEPNRARLLKASKSCELTSGMRLWPAGARNIAYWNTGLMYGLRYWFPTSAGADLQIRA